MSKPAFPNAYTDPNITLRDLSSRTIPVVPPIAITPEPITDYEAAGTNHSPTNSSAVKPPIKELGETWQRGATPYGNKGMTGQSGYNNANA